MISSVQQTMSQKIETEKVNINDLFKNFWFRIPEYQRSYVWCEEQLDELLDDLHYAQNHTPEKEYFLGSVVLQKYRVQDDAQDYTNYDVLDGQQRLTTLFLLMAVLRDSTENGRLKENTAEAIFQEADPFDNNRPERIRIEFLIRDKVEDFIQTCIKLDDGTKNSSYLEQCLSTQNISLRNMAKAISYLQQHFSNLSQQEITDFAKFLFNKVILIYVASENLEDAFRLFTILNNRGIPLSHSDILKSWNIGAVADNKRRLNYAQMWERIEGEFGRDEYDRFLNHIRTIFVKEKARENLLNEFENIYAKGKLHKGEDTLKIIETYRDHFSKLIWLDEKLPFSDYSFNNLIKIMTYGLSTDWIPPLLFYYECFKEDGLIEFLLKLESKVSADWILQKSPTERITNTYSILKAIEIAGSPDQILQNGEVFSYDRSLLKKVLEGDLYGTQYGRYVLLKLEYLDRDKHQELPAFTKISVEHVLPQTPKSESQWCQWFNEEERFNWTNKISNLVLLSRIKNSSLGNSDFEAKKKKYFESSINMFASINKAMQATSWTPHLLQQRQSSIVNTLLEGFK